MKIKEFDLTTSFTPEDPELAFQLAGIINHLEDDGRPVGLEVYPFSLTIPTKSKAIHTKDIVYLQNTYNAKAKRFHLPWLYDWAETRHQIVKGDWYHGLMDRVINAGAFIAMGPANNNRALEMAHELGIGVNVHPNVTAGYAKDGKIDYLMSRVPFVLFENSVNFGSIYQPNRAVLGDPTVTVRHEIQKYGRNGFLLAIDHMYGLDPATRPSTIKQRTIQILKVLEDPQIQENTEAMHVAFPGHGFIEIGDPNMTLLFKEMAQMPFKHEVSPALDVNPIAMKTMSKQEKVDYIRGFREWMLNTVEKYN